MLSKFLPKQDKFFDHFETIANLMVESVVAFHAMLQDPRNLHYVDNIAHNRKMANQMSRHILNLLHKTFITPFDRYDMNSLISGLGDIHDLVNRCAQRFPIYILEKVPTEMVELAGFAVDAIRLLQQAVIRLHSMKLSEDIFSSCEKIDEVENHAHLVILQGEKRLFQGETDFRKYLRLKEMYDQIKTMINHSQHTANLIRGIVLEYT